MSEEKKELTVREAGKIGGDKRKAAIGVEGYAELGRRGGAATKAKYGEDFYSAIGSKGGAANYAKNGREFYEKIGKKGGGRVKELIERGKQAQKETNGDE